VSFQTSGSIDIAAPPQEVFDYLVDPEKIERWMGAEATTMPPDPSELRVGYRKEGTFLAPDGPRPITMEVTVHDPPREVAFRQSYAGGNADTHYVLAAAGAGTRLEQTSSIDYAAPAQPDWERMEGAQLGSGAYETEEVKGPVAEAMEKQLEANLAKLKEVAER
jgi:uncharacterized protein YndB with AHSA1/START domain